EPLQKKERAPFRNLREQIRKLDERRALRIQSRERALDGLRDLFETRVGELLDLFARDDARLGIVRAHEIDQAIDRRRSTHFAEELRDPDQAKNGFGAIGEIA